LVGEHQHGDKNNAAPDRGSVADECAEHTDDDQRPITSGKPDWVWKCPSNLNVAPWKKSPICCII
jgi:hypothetical protein